MVDIGWVFFFQAEDGIRDLVRSRGLGDVYKRQAHARPHWAVLLGEHPQGAVVERGVGEGVDDGRPLSLIHI